MKKEKDAIDIFGDDVKYYAYYDCANAGKAGARFEHKAIHYIRKTDGKIKVNNRAKDMTMLFFLSR